MQNHLDAQRSFSAMLGSDPMGFGPPTHEFTTLTSNHNHHSPEQYAHLLTTPTNGQGPINNNNTNNTPNHNNNNNNNNNNVDVKPKKVPPPNGKKTKGRVKIKMEFIDNKLRRYTTFSKRKTGIMKKAYELSTLTGTQVMLLVASETGHVYTFSTRKLQPMITSEAGKALIQTCLNAPDPAGSLDPQRMSATGYEETELTYAADPNASDHGDTKDGESESGSSDNEESMKEVPPPLIPLTNGLLPANFAALFASATAAGLGPKQSFPLDLASQISSQSSSVSSSQQSRLSQQELLQQTLLQQQQQLHQQIQLELQQQIEEQQQKLLQQQQHHNSQSSHSSTNNNNSSATSSASSINNSNSKVRIKREVPK